jgi:hypothetical protein
VRYERVYKFINGFLQFVDADLQVLDSDDTSVRAGVRIFGSINREYMDWQDILMIVIAALLLLVWVPVLFIAVRRALQADEKNRKVQ